jgi:hypothetical protein
MTYALHKKDNGRLWWWDGRRSVWSNLRHRATRFSYVEMRAAQKSAGGLPSVLWHELQPLTSSIPF